MNTVDIYIYSSLNVYLPLAQHQDLYLTMSELQHQSWSYQPGMKKKCNEL